MVNSTGPSQVTRTPPVKEFILFLNIEQKWGVVDLDETHLFFYFMNEEILGYIQQKLDELQDANTYELNSETRDKLFRIS